MSNYCVMPHKRRRVATYPGSNKTELCRACYSAVRRSLGDQAIRKVSGGSLTIALQARRRYLETPPSAK